MFKINVYSKTELIEKMNYTEELILKKIENEEMMTIKRYSDGERLFIFNCDLEGI